jgi:hypothetical protein
LAAGPQLLLGALLTILAGLEKFYRGAGVPLAIWVSGFFFVPDRVGSLVVRQRFRQSSAIANPAWTFIVANARKGG